MRIRGVSVVLVVTTLAILGGAMTISHRRSLAKQKPLGQLAAAVVAQEQQSNRTEFGTDTLALERKLVKGVPFSATLLIEQTREGSSETRTTTSQVYRDAEGRTRRDQMRANNANDMEITTITDPVAGFAYELQHSDSTARRTTLGSHAEEKTRDSMAAMRNSVAAQQRAGSYQMLPVTPDGSPKDPKQKSTVTPAGAPTTESLGEREIEGVTAEGTRTIVTIPPGALRNELPMQIVTERWYSPKLKSAVLIERVDPRVGRSVYRLTGIKRTEPAASLFTVPGNYKTIVE